MTFKENFLSSCSVLSSVLGISIAIAHTLAMKISMGYAQDPFIFMYHFIFATITTWMVGLLLSVIAIGTKDMQGKCALSLNFSTLIIIIACIALLRSFGAF